MSEVKEGQQAELLPARRVLCPVPCGGFNLEHADYCNWCGRQLRQHKAPATAPPSVSSEPHAECGIAHDEDVDCDEARGIMAGLEDIAAGRTKPLEQIEREMSTGHNALPVPSAVVREALEQIAAMTCSCHDANNEGWHSQHCAKRIALQGLAALPAPSQREAHGPTCHKCGKLVETGDILCTEHELELLQAMGQREALAKAAENYMNAVGDWMNDIPEDDASEADRIAFQGREVALENTAFGLRQAIAVTQREALPAGKGKP